MVTVDTPRTQALIGFLQARRQILRNFSANIRNQFAALVPTSLDARPIAQSSRPLLVAASRVTNNGNGPPTMIEPVTRGFFFAT